MEPTYGFKRVVIQPGQACVFQDEDWRGALVIVESGALELESQHGILCRFELGDVLALQGLHLRALHNPCEIAAVLAMSFRAGRV